MAKRRANPVRMVSSDPCALRTDIALWACRNGISDYALRMLPGNGTVEMRTDTLTLMHDARGAWRERYFEATEDMRRVAARHGYQIKAHLPTGRFQFYSPQSLAASATLLPTGTARRNPGARKKSSRRVSLQSMARKKSRKAAPKARRKARRNPYRTQKGRVLKVENVRGKRSAKAIMRKARIAAAKGKPIKFDVTRSGKRRSVKAAALALRGLKAKPKRGRAAAAAAAAKPARAGAGLGRYTDASWMFPVD